MPKYRKFSCHVVFVISQILKETRIREKISVSNHLDEREHEASLNDEQHRLYQLLGSKTTALIVFRRRVFMDTGRKGTEYWNLLLMQPGKTSLLLIWTFIVAQVDEELG